MALIQLTNPTFYKNGQPGHSEVVGFESGVTRVARYTFRTPDTGATALSFQMPNVSYEAGTYIPIRFAVTAEADSHCNAGETAPYQGTAAIQGIYATGQLQLRLEPNATYYLWFFPGRNTWGWYYFPLEGELTLTGTAQGVPAVEGDHCLGDTVTITIASSPQYTHRLTWQFADQSGVIGEALTDSAVWVPPLELAQRIPNSPSGLCTVTCYTYEGQTQVGDAQSVRFTLAVPQSLAPIVTATFRDVSGAWTALGTYAEKVSRLSVTAEATARYGATVAATGVLLDDRAYGGGTLPAGEHILAVTATDSRGLTGRAEYPIAVAAYDPPQLELHASRCQADGTPDDTGAYARVTLTGAVTDLPGNTAALTLTYGKTTVELPVAPGSFTEVTCIPAERDETLALSAVLTDALRSVSRAMTLSTAYATMDFLCGGKGIAFGKVAQAEGFHCAMDAYFSGRLLDAQGRELVGLQALAPEDGVEFSVGRVLSILGARTLQLQFSCEAELPADTLLTASVTGEQTIFDATGAHPLRLTAAGLCTAASFPPGAYTFHHPL